MYDVQHLEEGGPNTIQTESHQRNANNIPTIDLYALIGPNTDKSPFSKAFTIKPLPNAPVIPPAMEYHQKELSKEEIEIS